MTSPFEPESAATRAVRAGLESDATFGAVVPPIYLSSNFAFAGFGEPRAYDYTRSGNPTRDVLAGALAALEKGAGALITSTGMSAILTVVTALVPRGSTVVIPHDCYGGTWRLFNALESQGAFTVRLVDQSDHSALRSALDEHPALVLIETPSNPLLRITDIAAVAGAARAAGALVVADNTFCTPLLQRPLEFGCDLVVHSTTKYLNGHSDVVGGAVVSATTELAEQMAWWGNVLGVTASPFDAYLTMRGVRSLHARMAVHQVNASVVAQALAQHPRVRRVYYPGLPDHSGHDLAALQQDGFGAMVSVELNGDVAQFCRTLRCFSLAESLGGVESLVAHPATMTHASMTDEARAVAGISDALLRLSIGIEAADDLVADLRGALDAL